MKECNSCKKTMSQKSFTLNAGSGDGLSKMCKDCEQSYRIKNRERIRQNWRRWREKNQLNERIRKRCDYALNKQSYIERNNENYKSNRDQILEKRKKRYHEEGGKEANQIYRALNHDKIKKAIQKRRAKIKSNPLTALECSMKKALDRRLRHWGVKARKSLSSCLGTDIESLFLYIESQFYGEMSWQNYGELWGIYLICPLQQAKTDDELYRLNNYLNLEPRLSVDRYRNHDEPSGKALLICRSLLGRDWDFSFSREPAKKRSRKKVAADFVPTKPSNRLKVGGS